MRFKGWPVVRRRLYRRCVAERDAANAAKDELQEELQLMRDVLIALPGSLARAAGLTWLEPPPEAPVAGELCLFVTHMAIPQIKTHVADHVSELIAAGIAVILIVNTDLESVDLQLPPDLKATLHGCAVRQNVGYDFGAWAHVYSLLDTSRVERLYLVNDSIVGPLDRSAFATMLSSVRSSDADMVGLTGNPHPKWHLQSFFLVINSSLLLTKAFSDLMRYIVNLPSKEAVINSYETQISPFLIARGFRCATIFPNLEPGSPLPDDTYFRWSQLVESGFPFIKASILKRVRDEQKAIQLVPEKYRNAAKTVE